MNTIDLDAFIQNYLHISWVLKSTYKGQGLREVENDQ